MTLIFLAALLAVASAGNFSVIYAYPPGSTCNGGGYTGFVLQTNSNNCVSYACTCSSASCSKAVCGVTSVPSDPSNAIVSASYAADNCQGDPSSYVAATSGICTNSTVSSPSSTKFTCSGGNFVSDTWSTSDCSGATSSHVSVPFSGSVCIGNGGSGSGSTFLKCTSTCFHKDTKVDYEGKQLTVNDIPASKECTIPHHVVADGVKITTTCPGVLRLTYQHLVKTPAGWEAAGNLKKGDSLFSKVGAETADCTILSIETELKQEYFGLNCLNSEVLADGYWVSTFGNKHAIPAAWMKYGGSVLGIHRASAWGDAVLSFLEDWNLVSRD